jgi:hypothetical protein
MHRTHKHRVDNTRVLELSPVERLGTHVSCCAWRMRIIEAFNACHTLARPELARCQPNPHTGHPYQPEYCQDCQQPTLAKGLVWPVIYSIGMC